MSNLLTQGLGGGNGGGVAEGFQIDSATGGINSITLVFSAGFAVTSVTGPSANPANWEVAPTDGSDPVTVLGVAIVGSTLVLTTTNQSGGGNYLLSVPLGIVSNGIALLGPFLVGFTGVATTPAFLTLQSIDAQLVNVSFTVPPDKVLVGNPAKWSISPTLSVFSVKKITDTLYQLKTSPQGIGVLYTVTWPV